MPYPHAAGDHQFYNAKFIVDNDLGWCQREGDGLNSKLLSILDEPLKDKSARLLEYSAKDVAHKMIADVRNYLKVGV